jgi:hypothetical protein
MYSLYDKLSAYYYCPKVFKRPLFQVHKGKKLEFSFNTCQNYVFSAESEVMLISLHVISAELLNEAQ